MKCGWKEGFAGRRKDREELFVGEEGFAHLEGEFHAAKVLDVGDVGGEVVGEKPGPRHATVVVVVEVPLNGPEKSMPPVFTDPSNAESAKKCLLSAQKFTGRSKIPIQ